jgi:hypothetical protein
MTLRHGEKALAASWDDAELFRYVYEPDDPQLESPRPYFHPVRTLRGDVVSLYRPHDHVWHKGIALSLPNVGQENFWGGPTFRAGEYIQVHNDGSMRHESFDVGIGKDDTVRLDERLTWVTEAGETPITEHRRIGAAAWPAESAWWLAFETTLTNVSGADIMIGSPTTEGRPDAGYGGLFWRGPRSFTGGLVVTPSGTGGDEVMGASGRWLGFTGQHDGHGRWSTLVFRDAGASFNHPGQWFVRTTPYACVCPAPFYETEYVFGAGSSLTLRYDVAIADGELGPEGCAALVSRAAANDLLASWD